MEKYGLMILDNVGGMDSKVSTISLYMYNYIIIDDSFRELKTLFLDMAKDEMKHLNILMNLALTLNMNPRWWTCLNDQCCYWSPSYLNYSRQITNIIINALEMEYKMINKLLYQINIIEDPKIISVLNQIIYDKKKHITLLKKWETKLVR